jgi:hypothetical protein
MVLTWAVAFVECWGRTEPWGEGRCSRGMLAIPSVKGFCRRMPPSVTMTASVSPAHRSWVWAGRPAARPAKAPRRRIDLRLNKGILTPPRWFYCGVCTRRAQASLRFGQEAEVQRSGVHGETAVRRRRPLVLRAVPVQPKPLPSGSRVGVHDAVITGAASDIPASSSRSASASCRLRDTQWRRDKACVSRRRRVSALSIEPDVMVIAARGQKGRP